MSKKTKRLDAKDLDIVDTLDRLGPKVSTRQLSRLLHIPSRTVRYRLTRLRDRGFLQPFYVLTHERKLGLAENIIVVEEATKGSLRELFEAIPYFYWHSPTYGKYNGQLLHSVCSLTSPDTSRELLRAMQRKELISNYYVFEIVDYAVKNLNLTYFNPERGWTWNWDKWVNNLKKRPRPQRAKEAVFNLDENPGVVDFDFKDVLLLRHMLENPRLTLKQLGQTLDLSEAQISKRVQRLEEKGVIKGYKSVFNPTPIEELLSFYCFIETEEPTEQVLSCFYQLPYTMDVLMESRKKLCIRLRLSAGYFNGFLRGFDLLRPYFVSYFFQTVHHEAQVRIPQVFNLFNKDTRRWETPTENYIRKIEAFSQTQESKSRRQRQH